MKTKNLFNGKKYENASQHQQKWGNKLINELKLNGNEKILDLAAGMDLRQENLQSMFQKAELSGLTGPHQCLRPQKPIKPKTWSFCFLI